MRFLVLILAVVLIYATGDVFGDLLGQNVQYVTIDHTRERRQTHGRGQGANYRSLNQAPAQIQQLLQAQQAREPLVHLPPQPPPRLGPSQPIKPQYQSQAQAAGYKPQVQYANAPQQPTYKDIPVPQAQYRQPAAQPQYRPAAQPQFQGNYPQAQNRGLPYKPISAPQQAQPQYSNRLPPQIQQLLQLQANLPNTIPTGTAAPRKY